VAVLRDAYRPGEVRPKQPRPVAGLRGRREHRIDVGLMLADLGVAARADTGGDVRSRHLTVGCPFCGADRRISYAGLVKWYSSRGGVPDCANPQANATCRRGAS
jgi:hypothetical protein